MVYTSKSLLTLFALASTGFAIPGPSWYRRQADAQTSLTLDPAVISNGLAQDGQGNNPDPGQVRSLTSTNNFINFCLTQDTALTDGQQKVEGSCNPTPMGRIISLDVSPSAKFLFPKNTDSSLQANQAFTIQLKARNMQLGNFVNAQSNYYAAPQQVNGQGIVIGHSHVVIEFMAAFDSTEPLDPLDFEFFKGINGPADNNGIVAVAVDKGVKAGFHRLCTINTAANHQPVLVSNAQHGSLDDCVYFAVGQGNDPFKLNNGNNGGNNNGGNNNGGNNNGGNNNGGNNNGGNNNGGNNNGGNNNGGNNNGGNNNGGNNNGGNNNGGNNNGGNNNAGNNNAGNNNAGNNNNGGNNNAGANNGGNNNAGNNNGGNNNAGNNNGGNNNAGNNNGGNNNAGANNGGVNNAGNNNGGVNNAGTNNAGNNNAGNNNTGNNNSGNNNVGNNNTGNGNIGDNNNNANIASVDDASVNQQGVDNNVGVNQQGVNNTANDQQQGADNAANDQQQGVDNTANDQQQGVNNTASDQQQSVDNNTNNATNGTANAQDTAQSGDNQQQLGGTK
jgi:hypothetical protein